MKFRVTPLNLICILLAIFSLASSLWYININLALTEVWVANRRIGPKEIIKAEDLTMIKVPAVFLNDMIITDPSMIVGKNPISNYTIWRNAFIYRGTIEDAQKTKDGIHIGLKDNQVNYDLFIKDVVVNPSHLAEGLHLNIYLTVTGNEVVSDLLFEGVEIKALYDDKGQRIIGQDNQKATIITLAFTKEYVNILNEAVQIGQVSLIVGSDAFSEQDIRYNQNNKFSQLPPVMIE